MEIYKDMKYFKNGSIEKNSWKYLSNKYLSLVARTKTQIL